jgi:Zn-dependent protease with chaperone function
VVARSLGGARVERNTRDPALRRLHNVVEEMSIASGVTMPEVYVLENEDGINAFAAGNSPADAVVAVTRGAATLLTRDELQGVVAHEFSHVLNGDMRLNLRLLGWTFGLLVIAIVARIVLQSSATEQQPRPPRWRGRAHAGGTGRHGAGLHRRVLRPAAAGRSVAPPRAARGRLGGAVHA